MRHTPQIKKAIQFAARKHRKQYRAESEPLPYITHLFSVALLVAEDGADEEVVIAALLHDTLEDTDTMLTELSENFGERVSSLVHTVSEPVAEDGTELPWRERKEKYLEQIALGEDEALVIAIADKIDNIDSKLEAYAVEGAALFDRWGQTPENYKWYHGEVLALAQKRLSNHPLTRRLAEEFERERDMLSGI